MQVASTGEQQTTDCSFRAVRCHFVVAADKGNLASQTINSFIFHEELKITLTPYSGIQTTMLVQTVPT